MGIKSREFNKRRRNWRQQETKGTTWTCRNLRGQTTRGSEKKGVNTCLYCVHKTSFAFDLSASASCNYCYHLKNCILLPEEDIPGLFSMQKMYCLSVERKKILPL